MDTQTGELINVVDTEAQKAAFAALETTEKVLTQAEVDAENAKRETTGQGKIEKLALIPKKNCHRCHGRGHIGKNIETGLYVPCLCVQEPEAKKDRLWQEELQRRFGRK